MKEFYVTGGRQRSRVFKSEREWSMYSNALIIRLNVERDTSEVCVDYRTPPDARAGEGASVLFKSGTLMGNKVYVCTSTEVLIYELPSFRRSGYVSLPCFNDLHHVTPTRRGTLLVANTGLDMVVELTAGGEVVREWSVLGDEPWERFSRDTDYRKVLTTKPHRAHPNFVFEVGEDVWVTRGQLGDAVCLTHPNQQIPIADVIVHDGAFAGNDIHFTSVDGHLVIVNGKTMSVVSSVDLKTVDNECRALLGWCRGSLALDENRVWVGFTRIRKTVFKENVAWVKHVFRDVEKPTHLALYDLAARKCLQEIDLEKHGLNTVYSLFPA